ncbi:MAG: DUF521 domain-containing protein [Alphaproteobacteria bacterium]|nr:MAG: DUF521 domain-containing protein [Alphaproteobacteria bacterium]
MFLTDEEKAVLDGSEGEARAHAMDLMVRYAKALGAERLVETNNVCGGVVGSLPGRRDVLPEDKRHDMNAVYSLLNLDSDKTLDIPPVKTNTYRLIEAMDADLYDVQGVGEETQRLVRETTAFCQKSGYQLCNTCTPYQVGNVPLFGEHCAWMESSAVIYINSLIGARSNVEGAHSTAAASLIGKIPYWGYHIPENRRGTHLVEVEYPIDNMLDWGLMGYYVGEKVQENVPVFTGISGVPNANKLKHFGASMASSGGVEMYHIVGVTPEAPTRDVAFGGNRAQETIRFGRAELEEAYSWFSTAKDTDVDFVVLGCPHGSLEQVRLVAGLLEGKRLSANTDLWMFIPRSIKAIADRMGYTDTFRKAGAYLMTDSCAALSKVSPKDVKTAATDSCKQAHYLPATMGFGTWLGSTEQCVNAAISGKWTGGLE